MKIALFALMLLQATWYTNPLLVARTPLACPLNAPCTQTLEATGYRQSPLIWTVTGLPDGLTYSPAGTISGTATIPGQYAVNLDVRDTATSESNTTVTLLVAPAPAPPTNLTIDVIA